MATKQTAAKDRDATVVDPTARNEAMSMATTDPKTPAIAAPGAYSPDVLGAGFEDMDASDFLIPFLGILQKMSPQVDEEAGDKYVKGAKPGMIINSVTNELFDGKTGIRFIPVHRKHSFIEWIPRDQGGGFVAEFEVNDPKVVKLRREQKFGKLTTEDGNDLIETYTVYGILLRDDGRKEYGVLSMSSSNIKPYKQWMTNARNVQVAQPDGRLATPPMFAHVYRLRTRFNENKKGTWHGWTATWDGDSAEQCRLEQEHPLFVEAKNFRDMVVAGRAKAQHDVVDADVLGTEDGGEGDDKF
jgi:hypothetical protein